MSAEVEYHIRNVPYPWDRKRQGRGDTAWCLVRDTRLESGRLVSQEPVAIFNFDSEAEVFIHYSRDGGTVHIPKEWR